eukprot:gene1899-2156_t
MEKQQSAHAIVQAEKYLFTMVATAAGVIETHPVGEELGGNRKGILVESHSVTPLLHWIAKRMATGNVTTACTPYIVTVAMKEEVYEDDLSAKLHETIARYPRSSATSTDIMVTIISDDSSGSSSSSGIQITQIAPKSNKSVKPNAISDGQIYNGNKSTPVFQWKLEPYEANSLVEILLKLYKKKFLCTGPPTNVPNNVAFLVSNSEIENFNDLKCDSMGSWRHKGSPKTLFRVERQGDGDEMLVIRENTNNTEPSTDLYMLKRMYYVNGSDPELHKAIAVLYDGEGNMTQIVLLHYSFDHDEHEHMLGDVVGTDNLDKLPRGPKDLYNIRYRSKKERCSTNTVDSEEGQTRLPVDGMFTLLERAKREEKNSKDIVFIRECKVHPDFFAVLASQRQLNEVSLFCTNPRQFSVLTFDPTFNIFHANISLTVTTYRNLRLESKQTNKAPVFIGPLLLHRKKDWKTNSNFANSLVTEKEELEGVLACGVDGDKALMIGFMKNFCFAVFLRCFIHFKDNIKRELEKRGFTATDGAIIMEQIFGRQVGSIKEMTLRNPCFGQFAQRLALGIHPQSTQTMTLRPEIPPNILESIFTNANQLLKIPGLVMPTPGANNGSFIVAAGTNNTHTVKPDRGGSLECDKACLHQSTKLCEHMLAVAERTNHFHALISRHIKSKAGPKITEMALSKRPKNAGKKPSNRKRSNTKRPAVEQFIPLLEEDKDDDLEAVPQAAVSHAVSSKRRTLAVGPQKSVQSCTVVNSTMQMPCYSTQQFVMPRMVPVTNYVQPQVQRQEVSTTPASAIWSIKWVAGTNV